MKNFTKYLTIFFVMIFSFLHAKADDWGQFEIYSSDNAKITPYTIKAVFIGNSITEGWVKTHPDFFTSNNFLGRGISGQTTYQMLLRMRQDVLNLHPEYVIINGGINDIAENNHSYDEDRTFGNIISMCELADINGIKVVLTSVLPAKRIPWQNSIDNVPAKILSLNQRIKDYAGEKGYKFVDYYSVMTDSSGAMIPELTKDGLHPIAKGYEVMESVILPAFQVK